MSESIIKALVRLFALISDIHDDTVISGREKNIVYSFLSRHLNSDQVTIYMKLFDEHLAAFNLDNVKKDSREERKRTSLNSMRILSVCEELNKELRIEQKVFAVILLVDYISLGAEISRNEIEFLQTVSESFHIDRNDYRNIENFIMKGIGEIPEKVRVMVVDNKRESPVHGVKHRYCEHLEGSLLFLYIQSIGAYILRYTGGQDLYLNGRNILAGQTYLMDRGSTVRGQGIKTIYYTEVAGMVTGIPKGPGILIDAINVSFRFGNSENGIRNLNFREGSGNLVGIMGGSGVGKSTTLSILNGTLLPQEGKILINGYDLYNDEDKEAINGVIGFVPQDDLLIEELTVFQNLYYSAKLCLSYLSEKEIAEVVSRALIDFDLEETRDLRVGNPLKKVISGGQRKRLNIALELLREPTILFVDEPTSGLSSVDSEMVMNLLKAQAYKGKLVVVNIHQPSSEIYKMFDKIMIIDKGGYQVFYGNPNEAIVYFKERTNHANPEEDQCVKCGNIDTDQLLQIVEAKVIDEHGHPTRIRKVTPKEWADIFNEYRSKSQEKPLSGKLPLPENKFSIPGPMKQAGIFFTRDLLSKLYNKQFLLISLLGPPLLALLLAYFTRQRTDGVYIFEENANIPAFMFMCVITSLFFGLMISSEEIVRDRKLLKRESFLNLSWFSYLNSKVLMMFIISAVQTACFAFIGNAVLGIKGMAISYWLVLFTTSCVGNLIGLNISSAFNSVITIYILIPFIIIPQLLFSGVLVPYEKLNKGKYATSEFVPVVGDLMPGRWAFEALAVKQIRENEYGKNFYADNLEFHRYSCKLHLIDRLSEDLYYCFRNGGNITENSAVIATVGRYIDQLSAEASKKPGSWNEELSKGKIDSAIYRSAGNYLGDTLKRYFSSFRNQAQKRMDATAKKLVTILGESGYYALESNNNNRSLLDMILKSGAGKTTFERGDQIIPMSDPGFTVATSNYGRAHFYAPVKIIGTHRIDTYLFDLFVLWILSIILYILLYYKVPGRLLDGFGKLRFQKPEV
jgi:ABC transport system ATP-binding/permease protein